MNNNMNANSQKIPVNATEIVNKYRKLEDRLNFCLEKNWFHPNEIGYDANYFLLVIKGEKKYLPNNFTVNYNIGYFRNGEKLDKKYLIERMKSNHVYALYTPDICDPLKFSKAFLLKLIAYVDMDLFREIYSINKKQKAERNYNKWGDFKIDIKQEFIKDIQEFNSIGNGNNSRGGFRKSKNHKETNLFYQFKGKPKPYSNQSNNNNINQQINHNMQVQIQQLNKANNDIINENNKLKLEIQEIREKYNIKEENNIDKEIEMEDVNEKNNANVIINRGGPPKIGKNKNEKIEEGYSKPSKIEIKIQKKK